MEVKQIHSLMNNVTKEILGKTDLVAEDLSNVVDLGTELFNNTSVDNYVKSLVNHIGKVIFVNRPYKGSVPSMLMDSWEYGSVLEKISADIPEANENSEYSLVNGQSYDTNVFYKPEVTVKFFNNKVTFEIPMSFTERQVKESFSNVNQLNGFLTMLHSVVDKSLTVKMDSLIMRTINSMIANTFFNEHGALESYSNVTGMKAVNLLKLYKEWCNDSTLNITPEQAVTNAKFIKFASYTINQYKDRLSKISTLFNVGGKERFTPDDSLNIVMLSDFANSARIFLESDTFNNELVSMPNCETIPYWQGSGTGYSFNDVSSIDVSILNGKKTQGIKASGILAIMYDKDSMGVCNSERRVTTSYNAKGEFFNNYYKFDASYFNDLNENFIVFYVA